MRKRMTVLLAALVLGCVFGAVSAKAVAAVSTAQRFYVASVNACSSLALAFVWNYTTDSMAASSGGIVSAPLYLDFTMHSGQTAVGYVYDATAGRYVGAQAYIQKAL